MVLARQKHTCPDCGQGYEAYCSGCEDLRDVGFVAEAVSQKTSEWSRKPLAVEGKPQTSCQRPVENGDTQPTSRRAEAPKSAPLISLNEWEAKARTKKVAALVAEIDTVLSRLKWVDPYKDGALIARLLKSEGACWSEIAQGAGVRVPSSTTIAAVIAVYEGRVGR